MTPKQQATGELLTGTMESLTGVRRSDLAHYSADCDPVTKKLWIEGIEKEGYFHYGFEVGSQGIVGTWFIRPCRSFQPGYLFQSILIALGVLVND